MVSVRKFHRIVYTLLMSFSQACVFELIDTYQSVIEEFKL